MRVLRTQSCLNKDMVFQLMVGRECRAIGHVIKILETRKEIGSAIILYLVMVDSHALVVAMK